MTCSMRSSVMGPQGIASCATKLSQSGDKRQMFLPRRFVVRCRVPVPQLLASVDCPLVLSSCTCAAAPGAGT